jgi:AraC-like DNA-binding protein
MGLMVLGSFRGPAMRFDRTTSLVASSGLDHILVQLYVEGGFAGHAGDRTIEVEQGDICVFDMLGTLSTRSRAFRNLSFMMPRAALSARINDPSALHGCVIPASSPLAAILGDYLHALARRAPMLNASEAMIAALATASLVATILAGEVHRVEHALVATTQPSLLRRVSSYIDAHLSNSDLEVDTIVRDLGVSRAALYRLLTPAGGVGRFIRQRRLSRAALELANPLNHARIGEIAYRSGFTTEASFSRAFRKAFGITPSIARERRSLQPVTDSLSQRVDEQTFAYWLRTLHTPPVSA